MGGNGREGQAYQETTAERRERGVESAFRGGGKAARAGLYCLAGLDGS